MIMTTTLLKVLVTVYVVGRPPITELLPKEYPAMRMGACMAETRRIIAHARKNVKASASCVPADTRES